MVRERASRYERLGARYGRWVAAAMLLGVIVISAIVWITMKKPVFPRFTVVLAGDPMVVWSWDSRTRGAVQITMPAATVIEAVEGYGTYSLEALWRLGDIERRGGTLLAESLQEALSLPIDGYVGPVAAPLTLADLPSVVAGSSRTNVPFLTLLQLVWVASRIRPDAVTTVDLSRALVSEQLPDGTLVDTPDPARLDVALGTLFEDGDIRDEGLSVAVFNTTDMPSLGSRVGKVLGRIGVFVVRVGNDEPRLTQCTVRGGKKTLASTTGRTIMEILGCALEEGSTQFSDLEVRVGRAQQARFLPTVKR